MTMNINELEKLAKAATPGPWEIFNGGFYVCNPNEGEVGNFEISEDSNYIAAANPSAISELIAAYREAVAALDAVLWSKDKFGMELAEKALATAKRLGVE